MGLRKGTHSRCDESEVHGGREVCGILKGASRVGLHTRCTLWTR